MSFNNIDIVYVKGSAYRIHFWYISKDNAINIMNGSNLREEKETKRISKNYREAKKSQYNNNE